MTIKRRVFYSFHYKPDNWRVATVRNIGSIEGKMLLKRQLRYEEVIRFLPDTEV